MQKLKHYVGERLGKLTLESIDSANRRQFLNWKCDCGSLVRFRSDSPKRIFSCGCDIYVMPGKKYGRLTVLELLPNRRVSCRCDCGNLTDAFRNNLPRGNTQSCGCIKQEMYRSGGPGLRNGHSRNGKGGKTRVYRIWTMMHDRCVNPGSSSWEYYGDRGIKVCDRWKSFEAFLEDMGDPSPHLSIDRLNNDGNYEPGNCRWATASEQSKNRRPRGKKHFQRAIEACK